MQEGIRTQENNSATEDRNARLTRENWLELALQTLVEDGIDRVKIQIMAKRLDVARSSFYWHFESSEALHGAMLEEWLRKNTSPIIERAMRPAPDIMRAIINVFDCRLDDSLFNPPLDIAVRLWARRSDRVRAVVLQADEMRVDALRRMFLRYGYEAEDALIRARVLYYTQIGQYTLEEFETPELRFSHGPAYMRIFAGEMPDAAQCKDFFDIVPQKFNPYGRKPRDGNA